MTIALVGMLLAAAPLPARCHPAEEGSVRYASRRVELPAQPGEPSYDKVELGTRLLLLADDCGDGWSLVEREGRPRFVRAEALVVPSAGCAADLDAFGPKAKQLI